MPHRGAHNQRMGAKQRLKALRAGNRYGTHEALAEKVLHGVGRLKPRLILLGFHGATKSRAPSKPPSNAVFPQIVNVCPDVANAALLRCS